MRLRLVAAFSPSVREKNAAIIRMIMARRELHRTILDQLDKGGFPHRGGSLTGGASLQMLSSPPPSLAHPP
eukprot:579242-Prymnesium_polylepis.1